LPEYTPEAMAVIEYAQREAQRLGYPFIQREQLFLGLLHDPRVGRILESLGLDVMTTRQQLESRLLPGLGSVEDPSKVALLPTAETVFRQRAKAAAALLGHNHIGTEHILLGFLLEQNGPVVEVLTALGASRDNVLHAIRSLDK
jgi:ATP-dependent Clp protease ATP-binding subunit ClpC